VFRKVPVMFLKEQDRSEYCYASTVRGLATIALRVVARARTIVTVYAAQQL
jgi:hypothetical protein